MVTTSAASAASIGARGSVVHSSMATPTTAVTPVGIQGL